ncbi:uncharacterized protein LOC141915317 [Tubulanus polymorphus]|uniref:uncharacterized protein LOC141915317 n=1 Tax=Tubulanus polymorphus TaxID=672921 RepID=UPI003DA28D37
MVNEFSYWCDFMERGFNQTKDSGAQSLLLISMPLIIIIGLCGNTLALLVIVRTKKLRTHGYSLILIFLITSDCTALVNRLTVWINFMRANLGLPNLIVLDSDAECLLVEMYGVATFVGAWLVVLISVERFCAVCIKPMMKRYLTLRNIFIVTLVTSMLAGSCDILLVYQISYVEGQGCSMSETSLKIYVMSAAFLIGPIPLIFICTFNSLILVRLRNRKYRSVGKKSRKRIRSKSVRATVMLLIVTFVWAILTVPHCASLVMLCIHKLGYSISPSLLRLKYVARTIYDLNYMLNFFLYFMAGLEFRIAFKRMFFKGENATSPTLVLELTPSSTTAVKQSRFYLKEDPVID